MRHWVGTVSDEQFATERLYARDLIAVPAAARPAAAGTAEHGEQQPGPGDAVLLVAAGRIFGHGLVTGPGEAGDTLVRYQGRRFDDPVPAEFAAREPGLRPLPADEFATLAQLAGAPADARSVWFVSVALPIEAVSRAEAVREFWTYLDKLGPRELPAYVWPLGDELAMQAFVLGAITNLDPEEDDVE